MANTSQSRKRARQGEVRRVRNVALRSRLRTSIKRARQAVAAGDAGDAQKVFLVTQKVIDSMVNKHIIHRNKAARHKHQLNAAVKALVVRSH